MKKSPHRENTFYLLNLEFKVILKSIHLKYILNFLKGEKYFIYTPRLVNKIFMENNNIVNSIFIGGESLEKTKAGVKYFNKGK